MKTTFAGMTGWARIGVAVALCSMGGQAKGADISIYGVGKWQRFVQADTAAPTPDSAAPWSFQAFAFTSPTGSILDADVQAPNGGSRTLEENQDGTGFGFEEDYPSKAFLDTIFGSGTYHLTMDTENDSITPTSIILTGDTYPPTPHISNYSEAQSFDIANDFTVTFDPFTGGTANDFVSLTIHDSFGLTVFDTGLPGTPGALDGTSTSAVIPADTLFAGDTFYGVLTFGKLTAQNTTDYPGALGVAGYFKETQFDLLGTATGGGDTEPPMLTFSSPSDQVTFVPTFSPVLFVFSEPMAMSQSIAWSSNLDPSKFVCQWAGQVLTCTYQGGLPADASFTWTLNPAGMPPGFTDLAGNPLPTTSGSFSTGAGSVNPCDGGTNGPAAGGSFSLFKSVDYTQTSDSVPAESADMPANFYASASSPTNNPLVQVSVQLPGGASQTFSNFFNTFFLSDSFSSENALDAAYPGGTYTGRLTRQNSSTPSVALAFPSNPYPPIPQLLNYTAAQSIAPGADFVLQWNAFTGAGPLDHISLEISDNSGVIFAAPDPCIPRALTNTATSITIPADTLLPGKTYDLDLIFSRLVDFNTNTISDVAAFALTSRSVHSQIRTAGGVTQTPPTIRNFNLSAGGPFSLAFDGQSGVTYQVEGSVNLSTWTTLLTTNSPSGVVQFQDIEAAGLPHRFYRIEVIAP